jgi:cytoskeletal protein RodZ
MPSFGDNLRRERELRGVSLREIADATKISMRFLQALEADRIDVLPGGLFRKAFVRQYAKHVGLDPERMVAEFLFVHGDGEEPLPAAPPRRFAIPQGAFTLLGAAALLAWLAYPRGARIAQEETAPGGAPDQRAAPTPHASAPREAVFPAAAASLADEAPGRPSQLTLSLTADQECWVQVTVDGESVLNRVLAAGESETVAGEGEIVLSVGNAGGVRFRVNDQPGVPLGRSGEVKRNIVITRQSLPSLVEQDNPPSPAPPSG